MCSSLRLLFCAMLLLASRGVAADSHDRDDAEDVYRIHVITIGPGDELFTRFGHIALMVENRNTNERLVYNFGTFDFEDPKLRFRYARGFLNYWLSVVPFEPFLNYYARTNRDVWLQTLNFSDAQAREVAERLRQNARPENRYYLYRHFLDNCCTRVRDVIDDATDGAVAQRFQSVPVERDFRYWTARSLEGLPLYRSVILYSLGPAIDAPITRWDEEFLPSVFFEDLDKITVGKSRVPLVARKQHLFKREGPAIGAQTPAIDMIVIGVLAVIFVLGFAVPHLGRTRPWSRRLLGLGLVFWGLLAGLGGLMLVLYWTVTTHFDTHYNENLLVNPVLHLWLVGPGLALLFRARIKPRTQKVIRWYLLGALGLIALDILLKIGPFIQGNWGPIILSVTLNAAALFALKRTGALSSES